MAIQIQYTPSLPLASRAAYVAGLGQYAQRQQELAQQERMQIRSIEANLFAQQQAQIARGQLAQQEMALQHAEKQQQLDIQSEQFALERADKAKALDTQVQLARAQIEATRARDERMFQNDMQKAETARDAGDRSGFITGSREAVMKRFDTIDAMLESGRAYDETGQANYGKLKAQRDSILADRELNEYQRSVQLNALASKLISPRQTKESFQDFVDSSHGQLELSDGTRLDVVPTRAIQVLGESVTRTKTSEAAKSQREAAKPAVPMDRQMTILAGMYSDVTKLVESKYEMRTEDKRPSSEAIAEEIELEVDRRWKSMQARVQSQQVQNQSQQPPVDWTSLPMTVVTGKKRKYQDVRVLPEGVNKPSSDAPPGTYYNPTTGKIFIQD